jgi:hypothetical protein
MGYYMKAATIFKMAVFRGYPKIEKGHGSLGFFDVLHHIQFHFDTKEEIRYKLIIIRYLAAIKF